VFLNRNGLRNLYRERVSPHQNIRCSKHQFLRYYGDANAPGQRVRAQKLSATEKKVSELLLSKLSGRCNTEKTVIIKCCCCCCFCCKQGRNEGGKGNNAPDATGSRRKVLTMSQVLSSIQCIYSQKISGSNIGALNLFLAPNTVRPWLPPGHKAKVKLSGDPAQSPAEHTTQTQSTLTTGCSALPRSTEPETKPVFLFSFKLRHQTASAKLPSHTTDK